ncbi:MAG: membrane protein insertion efficiency factor YidD [bacterium]
MKKIVVEMIKAYQYITQARSRVCRFSPSCSEYMLGSVEQFGAAKGVLLGIIRIAKCNPFHPGGHDPVKKKNRITYN